MLKRGKWWKVPLAVVLVFVAVCGYGRYRARSAVQAELERIREEGYPVTLAELNDWYATPTGENAAEVYQRAFMVLVMEPVGVDMDHLPVFTSVDLPGLGEPMSAEMRQAIVQMVAANREGLSLLHEAATIEACRYGTDFRGGINTLLPHLGTMRRGARILKLESLDHAMHDRSDEAIVSTIATLHMGLATSKEPILIPRLVGVSIYALALDHIEWLLYAVDPSATALSELQIALQDTVDPEALARAYVGERAVASDFFSRSYNELQQWGVNAPMVGFNRITGLIHVDHLFTLRYMRQAVENAQDPMNDGSELEALGHKMPITAVISREMLPALGTAIRTERRSRAWLRTAIVAVAVERYRAEHDELPSGLDALVPDFLDVVPIDPFDGKPLRYKLSDERVLIYCIGRDRVDNDGYREMDGNNFRDGTDIVFILPR